MSEQVSSTRKLVSASALMASGTLISRVLGMVRVVLIVFILGASSRQADLFELANTVPNSIYILFAGGALNTVLVPQIVRAIKHDPDGGEAYTNRMITAFMLIVGFVTVVVTFGAPVVAGIYASSSWRVPELADQYASLIALTYLTLPQIFFYGAFFLLGQVLNARDRFGPMMWAPIANNVVSILVLSLYFVVWGNQGDTSAAFTTGQIWVLGAGSTLGIIVQAAVLVPYVRKVGFRIRPRFDLKGTGLGKTFKLAGWTLGFVAVNQLALIVVQRLATSATTSGSGAGMAVYNNAHLLWILPHSLITVSLATAMLPAASRLAAAGDRAGVAAESTKTMRLALVVIVPATVVFFALSGPIAGILYGHGQNPEDATLIAWTLMAFAVGLIPFTVQFVCLRTYYALEDTRTPFLLQVLIAGMNALGAVLLVGYATSSDWYAPALGLAYSLAYAVGVFVSWQALRRRVPDLNGGGLVLHIVRLLIGSSVGGVGAYYLADWLIGAMDNRFLAEVLACVVGGLLILGSYLLVGKLLKVRELKSLSDLLRKKLGRGARPTSAEAESTDDQATMLLPTFIDDTPTRVSPVVDDLDDGGPATVVRNRPPVSSHTFEVAGAATLVDDTIFRPVEADGHAQDEDAGEDDEVTGGVGGDDEDTKDTGDHDTDQTGRIDFDSLFRDPSPTAIATVGTLLNTRYELVSLLTQRHGTQTWRAHDQVLSRDVVVHVVARGDERITELMTAARKGAVATDSRFLRVLDADELTDPDQPIGAYVVAEYAHGRSLSSLLEKGPLSAIEAAWIVRELADALVSMHAQGLFHEQLNPDNVIITGAGAVRLVGFGIEASLAGRTEEGDAWAARESADVTGLAGLLYAGLVRHWPTGPAYGMPAAPIVAGEPAAPHTVAAGISPALDRICVTTLTQRGALSERRITTASQLVNELTLVLGTADASADLEQRVRSWHRTVDAPFVPASPATPAVAPQPIEPVTPSSPNSLGGLRPAQPPRRVLWILVILAVLTLVISLIAVGVNSARDNAAQQQPSTSAGAQQSGSAGPEGPLTVVAARDFDPEADGGNGEEYPDQVAAVFDGDPATSWKTMSYKNRPDLGGLKPGVGVILDLGEPRTVSAATLVLGGGATGIELRVPATDEPSMATVEDWTVVGADAAATGTVTVPLTTPTETRHLMVYFTNLPPVGDRYIGELFEVTLS